MKTMKKSILAVLSLFTAITFTNAQAVDSDGCKDYPMFSRMPDYLIQGCTENFSALDLVVGITDGEAIKQYQEGTLTHLDFYFNDETQHKHPSWLQITKNYENAILKLGGKKLFSDNNYVTYKISKNGKDIWVMLTFVNGTDTDVVGYYFDAIEIEAMKQEIVANEIYTALNNDGYIALYLNFATGKSTIESESDKQIDEIVQMMKTNSSLKISIEGHTDNVGDEKSNQTLSDDRAKAVMNSIIAKGIDKSRLSSKGWGQSKPIADNRAEDGKAKNRRVEIVKK